jgi:hypothetical protein
MGSWTDKVLALLPAEVTAVYLAVRSVVALVAEKNEYLYKSIPLVLFISIVVLTIASPVFARVVRGLKSKSDAAMIAVSFPIWALNIDYQRMIDLTKQVYEQSQGHPVSSALPITIVQFALPITLIMWAGLAIPIVTAIATREASNASH